MKRILQILAAITAGSGTLVLGIKYAYEYRGYRAIGSEYIFAILAAIEAYWLIGRILKK